MVATPSVLAAAGLFTLSGIAGGFLATGQTQVRQATPTMSEVAVLPQAPAAMVQPVVAPVAEPDLEELLPPVLEAALELPDGDPVPAEDEELVFTSLSIDAATGREERRNPRPALTEEQAELCRSNLQAAAERLSVRFSHGSRDAAPEDMDAAFSFAEGVAVCGDVRVLVRGHADSTGDETQNLLLSWERAEAVIEAIAAAGHDTSIYEPVGFGSRQLLLDEATQEAEALNRRVEFAVVERRQ
ncbi:OmpA family protein [Hasllibacter sp. MH4015]|uniref:OmpA family protein n=1 Tax=Hasllibacter sp. MH4015 TaxID=2854029 RepID=UPI001CD687E3|nr:OmpA family protein [Hasllibacter sp. MH4015]